MEKQYLYTDNYIVGLKRYRITRQTKSNFWIYINEKCENKISKKKMSVGKGFHITIFKIETPELKKRYLKQIKYNLYLKKLEKLKENDNEETWDFILNYINE